MDQLRQQLEQDLTRVGAVLAIGLPLTGLVIVNRAAVASASLCALAEANPVVLRLLKAITGATVYGELAFIVGDVVVAAGVERGVVPVNHPMTRNIRQEISIVQAELARAAGAEERRAAEAGVTLTAPE